MFILCDILCKLAGCTLDSSFGSLLPGHTGIYGSLDAWMEDWKEMLSSDESRIRRWWWWAAVANSGVVVVAAKYGANKPGMPVCPALSDTVCTLHPKERPWAGILGMAPPAQTHFTPYTYTLTRYALCVTLCICHTMCLPRHQFWSDTSVGPTCSVSLPLLTDWF